MLIIKNNHLMSRNSQVALEILEMPFREQSSIHKQMRTNLQQKQKKNVCPSIEQNAKNRTATITKPLNCVTINYEFQMRRN